MQSVTSTLLCPGGIMANNANVRRRTPAETDLSEVDSFDRKFEMRATQKYPHIVRHIREGATQERTDMSTFARNAIEAAYERVMKGLPIRAEITTSDLEGAPMLDISTACGPASEMREQSSQSFYVSQDVADELGFDPDSDFFQRARGFSMQGAGILDEDVLCWSPLPEGRHPRIGQIALVGIDDGEGNVYSTAKYWHGYKGNMPQLKDGAEKDFPLSDNIARAWPIAILKGRVGGV